ncbi:ABC transporter ATP-binding protein [Actinoplanes cyaneus]|uniref:ABC transporter ATP-binding protein n=1 Tax=Actinoplanes cyaneus TaxID=52696 RepID=A0A919ILP2_9ACTN|nr:ATP-binding cassette domain-containing protein [Actinoplanes cyaneus]MCW2140016.1 ABC-type multidrug transport system, ATPase component [Actinoplanes cyaneus]GID67683.1 ABC transporter ATP-binding protein [Actinoplanes cyaneus]
MTTIRITGLGKRYGATTALDDLDLTIGRGVTGLLGPNGAGKTTLLRCLGTAQAPDSGRIEVFGLNPAVAAERTALRRRLGYLPQSPGLYPNFTAAALLDYVAVLKELTGTRQRRAEVRRVLDEVGLTDRARTKVRKLSGGMRQRLGLAQALLGTPDLLILDEPTVGLDPEQRMFFRALISRLGETRTVLLSTHQTEDVSALCERVIVLRAGRAVFDGTPRELAALAQGQVWLSADPPAGGSMYWRTADGDYRTLGVRPPGGAAVRPSIEDGYLTLLGPDAATAVR